MEKKIIAVSIQKIQTFLVDVLESHEQEKQTNSKTLCKIQQTSHEISEGFRENVKESLNALNIDFDILPSGSGNVLLSADLSDDKEVINKLDELYMELYLKHQGKMLVSYGIFPLDDSTDETKYDGIKSAKEELKKCHLQNEIILRNQQIFSFHDVLKDKEENKNSNQQDYYANTIDGLGDSKQLKTNHSPDSDSKRFRIAVLKADLDGMGDMFKEISKFSKYKKTSDVLNDLISIDNFHKFIVEIVKQNSEVWKDFKIFPFYIAGDDIFIAVHISNVIRCVFLLRSLIEEINSKINPQKPLTMRIGIDITENGEPIRYYLNRANRQMERAQDEIRLKKKDKSIPDSFQGRVSLDESVFYIGSNGSNANGKDNYCLWNNMEHAIKLVQYIKKRDNDTLTTFLYNLLAKVSDVGIEENSIELSNIIFYHLIPNFIENAEGKLSDEQTVKLNLYCYILSPFFSIEKKSYDFNKENLNNFKSLLRILLLCSDKRFEIGIKPISGKLKLKPKSGWFSDIKKYILQNNLLSNKLRDVFLKDGEMIKEKKKPIKYIRELRLTPSMIHRIKRLRNKANLQGVEWNVVIEKTAVVISRDNERIEREIEKYEEGLDHPIELAFDKEIFIEYATQENWSLEFIDTLLIYHSYGRLKKKVKNTNKGKGSRKS